LKDAQRDVDIHGEGGMDSDIQFRESFPSELTNGVTWDYDTDRLAFVSEWIKFEGGENYGAASLYIAGRYGDRDPCDPRVLLEFDAEGDGVVDEQSEYKTVEDIEEPVVYPSMSGDAGYYRAVVQDLRPDDIIDRVIFGPSHT
jgi:hypothetical protein